VAQGLVVEALVRNVAKARELLGSEAVLVEGDMTKPDTLDLAFAGIKRVIMAIGQRRGEKGSSSETVDFIGVKNVALAAKRHRIQKIVHVTSNGVDSPNRLLISFLNYMSGMGLGWKLRGEQALRDSGVPYVVVRPVGLKNVGHDVPPILKQCAPYEWGICSISRQVVGKLLVHALTKDDCTNCTLNCREDVPRMKAGKQLKDFDWDGALSQFSADTPIPATFDEHAQALEARKWQVQQAAFMCSVLAVGLLIDWALRVD
jgi:hypothetical protein